MLMQEVQHLELSMPQNSDFFFFHSSLLRRCGSLSTLMAFLSDLTTFQSSSKHRFPGICSCSGKGCNCWFGGGRREWHLNRARVAIEQSSRCKSGLVSVGPSFLRFLQDPWEVNLFSYFQVYMVGVWFQFLGLFFSPCTWLFSVSAVKAELSPENWTFSPRIVSVYSCNAAVLIKSPFAITMCTWLWERLVTEKWRKVKN